MYSLTLTLHSVRTKPCIFFCEDESGEKSGEYVVKLKAGDDDRETKLSAELIEIGKDEYLWTWLHREKENT